MPTRDDVLDAIDRIEMVGGADEATRVAQAALTLPLPPSGYDRVLSNLYSARPGSAGEQRGHAARAMKQAEAALAQQLSATAQFDRQILEALRHAHQTTLEGRRRLDGLEAEIAGAARAWDLTTAAGAREFQRFLVAKLSEIIRLVEDADTDDSSQQLLAAALTALYLAQSGRDNPAPVGDNSEPVDDPAPPPPTGSGQEFSADSDADYYPDWPVEDEPEAGHQYLTERRPEVPGMPMLPGWGGDGPGFGAMPAAMPAGFPPAGGGPGLDDLPGVSDYSPEDAGDAAPDGVEGDRADGDVGAKDPSDSGPVTVTLPDGATTSVANPRLAAAMQAVADGQPVAEAFRRHGIDLPPPGTPVSAPVEATRLRPGDIGVFTDRHALAVGQGRALLDGQVHLVDNLRGPGFLGWQHPPVGVQEPAPPDEPAPTRPAGPSRGAVSLKNPVPTVIADQPGG